MLARCRAGVCRPRTPGGHVAVGTGQDVRHGQGRQGVEHTAAHRRSDDDEGIFATVAVIGAGAMGSGIAQVAAAAGHRVMLVDAASGAAAARERIGAALDRLVGKGRIGRDDADATLERLTTAGR